MCAGHQYMLTACLPHPSNPKAGQRHLERMGGHHLWFQPIPSNWTYAPVGLVGEEGHTANWTQPGLRAHGPRRWGPKVGRACEGSGVHWEPRRGVSVEGGHRG